MSQKNDSLWKAGGSIWERIHGKSVFLTGGTGFFGKSLLEFLQKLRKTHALELNLTILSRNPTAFIRSNPGLANESWVHFIHGDVLHFEYPKTSFDFLLHFASPTGLTTDPHKNRIIFDTNLAGTRRVLDFASQCNSPKVLFSSSGAVYGPQPSNITHIPETYFGAPAPNLITSAYGEAKRASELIGVIASQEYSFDFKIARCFAFVGAYLDMAGGYAIGNFISNALAKQKIVIKGDGTPLRSYLYADDLCIWLLKILLDGKCNFPYNVGSDIAISIGDLAKLVALELAPNLEIETLIQPTPNTPPLMYVPNITRSKEELGLNILTPLSEAIHLTADSLLRMNGTCRPATPP